MSNSRIYNSDVLSFKPGYQCNRKVKCDARSSNPKYLDLKSSHTGDYWIKVLLDIRIGRTSILPGSCP